MAKVMVSMPDALLAELDRIAAGRKTSRSAIVREFAEQALQSRRDRINEIVDEIEANAVGHGGNVAELVRQDRSR